MRMFPKANLLDTIWINLGHALPYALRGIYTRNRFFFSLFIALGVNPFSVRFCKRLKRRYKSDVVKFNMLGRPTLLLFNVDDVKRVLDNSPDTYAEPPSKRDGMGHFQPEALTISRGDDWTVRRDFAEAVLASRERVHPRAEEFLVAVREEVGVEAPLVWKDFESMLDGIMQRVVFGHRGCERSELSDTLSHLMKQSNRIIGRRPSPCLAGFISGIGRQRCRATQGLLGSVHQTQALPGTRPDHQVPHWMFAIKDTVGLNAVRALALILSDAKVEEKVRDEIDEFGCDTPSKVDRLIYLEGCIQEAMRLWPSTLVIAREAIHNDSLGGRVVTAGTQILILNSYHHRNTDDYPDADGFHPEFWRDRKSDYRFNHFSNGKQDCPGKYLALFLAKALISTLLEKHDVELVRPRIALTRKLPYAYNQFKIQLKARPR